MASFSRMGRPDYTLFAVTLALLVIGIVMVFSSSYSTARIDTGDTFFFVKRQIMWAALGLVALALTTRIDYRFWRQWAIPGYVVAVALLGLVLLVGDKTQGARRWIALGFMNLQPSEPAKIAVVNLLAAYVATYRSQMHTFWKGLVIPMLPVALALGLIMKEPDLGTSVALGFTAFLMLFGAGVRMGHLVLAGVFAASVAVMMITKEQYRMRRIIAFLNPWADPSDAGWNIIQSLLAIGSGGLFGLGLGGSRQKFSYLPEQHTDFIFAILAEELGFLGSALVLLLFLVLAWRGYRIALKAPDLYGCMLAAGLTTMVTLQVVLNVAVVSALLPATGITLPLISSGGSSLLATLTGIGVLLNISAAGQGSVSDRA